MSHPNIKKPSAKPSIIAVGNSDKNVSDAEVLILSFEDLKKFSSKEIKNDEDIKLAAKAILSTGVKSVLVKNVASNAEVVQDFFCGFGKSFWITAAKSDDAKSEADRFVSNLKEARLVGLDIFDSLVLATKQSAGSFPSISENGSDGKSLFEFPKVDCIAPELYPIVDSSEWVKRLLAVGVKTIQLRIKNLEGATLEAEIKTSIDAASEKGAKLFINDFWELAIKHKAYGVHLGQDDILTADMRAIEKAQLRLGLSSHCYYEGAIAHGFRPSYIAFGPVYHTALKAMDFAPQGIENLKLWKTLFDCPLVAIGGITLDLADEVLEGEPDFISVVRDITLAEEPEARVAEWFEKLGGD